MKTFFTKIVLLIFLQIRWNDGNKNITQKLSKYIFYLSTYSPHSTKVQLKITFRVLYAKTSIFPDYQLIVLILIP